MKLFIKILKWAALPVAILTLIANLINFPTNWLLVITILPKWITNDWIRIILFIISLSLLIWIFWPHIKERIFKKRKIINVDLDPIYISGINNEPRIFKLIIGLTNLTNEKIANIKVKLIKLRLNIGFLEPKLELPFISATNKKVDSINPNDEERVYLGTYTTQNEKDGVFKLGEMEHQNQADLIFTLQISSESFPAFIKEFKVIHGNKGSFGIQEINKND